MGPRTLPRRILHAAARDVMMLDARSLKPDRDQIGQSIFKDPIKDTAPVGGAVKNIPSHFQDKVMNNANGYSTLFSDFARVQQELIVPVSFFNHKTDVGEHGFHLGINHAIRWIEFGAILETFSTREFLVKDAAPLCCAT